MKNLISILLLIIFYKAVLGQSTSDFYKDLPHYISDTIYAPSAGDYYVVDIAEGTPNYAVIVRKLSEKYAIIRSGKSSSSQQKQYYSLEDSWKLSSRIVKTNTTSHVQQIFSVKYAALTNPAFLSNYEEIELVRSLERARIALIKTTPDVVINQLIHNPNIEYVDRTGHLAREESPIRQYNMDLNRINYARHNYPHLDGKDMTISVKEHSIFDGDIDLIGRIILDENSSTEFTQHAKEMGTLIAGNGTSFKTGLGVASDAALVCTNFNFLFAEPASYYVSHSIKLQNHSYGTGIENYYGNETISYDQITLEQPDLVHVFSAGNRGDQAPEDGVYAGIEGYANLTGTFKQAKNVLVTGALDSAGNYVPRSSSGPTYDGRIKPELCAFGGEGSSESAALVSGSVAMLQNQYMNTYDGYPSGSLVKSLLIAGATDVHTPGIDFKTGYGSLDLNTSLQVLDSGWFKEEVITTNTQNSSEITVPDNVDELKVVVAWIDPPANPEDATALVNDLDMSVRSPSNDITLPWVLNTSADASSLAELPVRGEDHLNNVEMITIENPEAGSYRIAISSHELAGNDQAYTVAYHINYKDNFVWTFPTASDQLEAGSQLYVRWDNSFAVQDADLSIKYGQGTWESLGQVNVNAGFFKYMLKDTSVNAQLRMTVSGVDFFSDVFAVSRLSKITVENDCDDEFILSWNAIENRDYYQLYELENDKLVQVLSTTDTLLTLQKTVFDGSYYAVQPVFPNAMEGLRSYAINYEEINKGCFLDNFLAYLGQNDRAIIQLSVNMPQDIEKISIQKEQGGIRQVFAEFPPDEESFFDFEDGDLSPGRVAYSTQLVLNKGTTIFSDTLGFYYTNENTIIIFPNPVYADFVSVLNDFPGGSLQLLDSKGTFIRSYELVNMVEPLEVTGLRSGTYIFRIFYEGGIVHSGKLIRM